MGLKFSEFIHVVPAQKPQQLNDPGGTPSCPWKGSHTGTWAKMEKRVWLDCTGWNAGTTCGTRRTGTNGTDVASNPGICVAGPHSGKTSGDEGMPWAFLGEPCLGFKTDELVVCETTPCINGADVASHPVSGPHCLGSRTGLKLAYCAAPDMAGTVASDPFSATGPNAGETTGNTELALGPCTGRATGELYAVLIPERLSLLAA